MSKKTLSGLFHGPSKVGKTTLLSTSPVPILAMDAEGGWNFIATAGFKGKPLVIKEWNPMLEPPPIPTPEDPFDICHVLVQSWAMMVKVYQRITQEQHAFRTIILDSITEIQRRCKTNLVGTEQMKIQDWGSILTAMDSLIRSFRDLKEGNNTICAVFFIAETRKSQHTGVWEPYMQGQISVSLPYWMDIVGYLYSQMELDPTDPNGQRQVAVRKLLIGSHPQFVTGERVQGRLPDVIDKPDIQEMFIQVFGDNALKEA